MFAILINRFENLVCVSKPELHESSENAEKDAIFCQLVLLY